MPILFGTESTLRTEGWDYEPQDDETHVGADIERIRSMWNKYCDDDFELKNLDEVYNRMKQKYGTVAVLGGDWNRKPPHKDQENTEEELEGDGNKDPVHKDEEHSKGLECMKIKIQSIKLNPDCTVEKGIVITENISTALKTLRSKNVVILKGVIGCGKTHALKAIKNHFQERNWKTVWVESENFEGEISHEKPTIFLLDNLFGKFGASVFSQDAVNKTEKALKVIESSKEESKVVIGIHTHVYDEVKKNLKLNFLHQKNITVEMDNLSEAETLLIFKKQLTNGHCEMNPNCWFKTIGFQSVLDKLLKNQGHVGGPFLSLMYCNQHELFSDEAFSVNPVQTLVQYMGRMRHDSPKLYHCLVYLMCVQQYNCEEEPEEWAGEIYVDITKDNFMDLAKTSGLLQVENKRATLAHGLLTTVLFKSAMESEIIIKPVLQRCKIDVILQLLRPTDSTQSDLYLEFTYTESSQTSKNAGKLCAYRLAQICTKQEINHPLMKIEFVKKKCAEYLKRDPKQLKGPK
uniref:Novel STAND NTPase 3 domain-containing protein n=1 Tax=Magallana gigas TaxID=29159 RepID=K1PVV3_MAGGI